MKIELNPVPENIITGAGDLSKPIILKNVFFETGSAALKKESLSELNRLKKLLKENPAIHIQINGLRIILARMTITCSCLKVGKSCI
ncbi:MAG: hypothetical protein R2825_17145 [Saprospiraceae bacterium]